MLVQDDGVLLGQFPVINFTSNIDCSPDAANGRANCSATGGGGGSGTNGLIGISACTDLSGSVTTYIGPGTCGDTREAAATAPVQQNATLESMACWLSGDTGAQTVTITARSGTCGSALSDASFVCTIGAGASSCDTSSASLVLSAGSCFVFRVSSTGALPAPRTLNCTAERSG